MCDRSAERAPTPQCTVGSTDDLRSTTPRCTVSGLGRTIWYLIEMAGRGAHRMTWRWKHLLPIAWHCTGQTGLSAHCASTTARSVREQNVRRNHWARRSGARTRRFVSPPWSAPCPAQALGTQTLHKIKHWQSMSSGAHDTVMQLPVLRHKVADKLLVELARACPGRAPAS